MSSKDKKKNKLAQSSASWLGVKPGQLNRNIQTSNKSVQQAQNQQHKTSAQTAKAAAPSSVSWRGTTPSQVARPAQQQTAARNTQSTVNRPQITPGRVSPAQQQRNAAQSARTLAQNDNSMRARIARSHEAERQRLAANAATIKQDKSRLASNSLLWHQTTDANRRQQLERENAAIRTRRGFGYDARRGSTFDTKGNELSLGARMIYGGKAETAKQFQQVAQTRDFVRDTSRTASQPSIYDVARGAKADDPYYALEAGAKAHNIVNNLLNRSGDTWTDADTKARDDARTALQNEMTALFRHYGVDYQPRWNEQQTAGMLRRAGADEGTVAYAMENVRLRDSTDRLGQGLEAIGKRAVASVPSLIDTAKQALANRNEDYENDEYRSLTEREQALEAQLQSMVSQNADGSVPEDYQRVYDELQNVRNRANALKTTKGVDLNAWSQTMLREANEAQANAEAGLAPAPRWLTEQAISLAGNAPSMAISALPGGTILGSALIGAQAAGQRMFELNEQGKNAGEALGRGLVSGVIEAATEKLPLEQMAEILHAGGTGAVKSILRQMGTEATEEGISYFLNYVSDRAASDPDAEFSLAELVQSAAGGAFGGLIFGATGNVASRLTLGDANAVPAEYDAGRYTRDVTAELQKADADLHAAKSLPEGAVRDRAIASAYQKMSETLDAFTSQQIAEKAEVGARERLLTEGMQVPERTAATAPVEASAPKVLDAAAQQAVERNRAAFDQARNIAQDAVRYGKTPEQAVMEAKVKREGEQARVQREQTETDLVQSRLADVWSELTELDARGLRRSDEFHDLWDEKNRLNDELAARGEKTGAVLPEIETPQTDSGEHLDPSIFKYPTQAEEMIRAGASAKRTAGDYLDTLKNSRKLTAADANKQLYHDLLDSYEKVRPIDAELEQARKITQLSQRDQKLLQSALLGGGREVLTKCENQPGAMRLYDLEVQKRENMKPVNEYNGRVRMEREMQADEWADRIAEFATDKKRGFYYITETPERNTYDIFGKNNRADAEEFNETFYKPVHEAVAEAIRLQNRLRDRISGLGLDKHESAMVQMIGEGKKAAALEYAERHGIKLDSAKEAKLDHAVDTFRKTYNELFDMINRAEVRNGLEPTRKRENYFPHFTEAAPDTLIARAMWRIGMKITGKETLPTDLAGQTENFRPGHKWERHLQHREGDATIYDAVKGLDQYIGDISQYIYLTDSIQNLRALEDAVRYRLSDEGTRAKIDEIKSNYSIDALERRQMMENTYDATDNRTPFQRAVGALEDQKRAGMRNFVVELRRYTDSLAGKKHRGDRGIEDIVGRDVYEISKNIEGRVAANMISLNPGSWLTNFIPLTQAGELSTGNLLQGMMDTIRSTVSDDGFVNASTFLTNRYGSDSISKTALRKISDAAGAPMEMIDHFVAETIVRARVAQNLKNHVMLDEAFSEADSYAASLMADRSKGATPGAFEMRNPIVKVFTMYQLETNNQLRHFFKDVPRDAAKRSNSKAGAIALTGAALTKAFAGAYVYNMIYHELTGRDSAFDPIGMIADAFGQLTDDDEDDKKKRALNAATSLGGSIAENLPFIGGVLGGGRVPVSAAIPDVTGWFNELNQGYDSKRLTQDAVKELAKPATYLLLPFGGGAVNRAVQGYMTVKNGGSYSYDKKGQKMLQFPVFGQKPEDWAKAMLFGKSSLDEAQNWKDNGYDSLYGKETEAFDTLRERMKWHGEDNSEAVYAAIKAMRELDADAQKRYPSNYKDFAATRKRQMLMQNNDLSVGQKEFLDRELISGGQSGNYTSQDAFDISQTVRESRQKAANEALKHGVTAEMFADWDGYLEELTKEQNDDGTKTYTTNTALGKVLEEVKANTGMTAGEKEALSDYLLISAMSESDRDKWNDEVRGKVNATDYVRFKSDLSAYQQEYKGTGADNAANIAEILRGYTNLTDEQRGVLMNTYSETAKSNPFHVSDLEKKLTDNSAYKNLNDSGRATLRTYCNEYEQAIADGKNLSGWKAKAYMAKEAGITPETYALFQTALKSCDFDENGSYKSAEIETAVKLLPGLTDKQRGYLWQAAKGGKASKNNPWGTTNVTKYTGSSGSAVNPVEGGTISSGFGPRSSPTEGASSVHKAIDIAAPLGTAVRAAMPGKIVEVTKGYNGGYGNTVSVDHGNGIITKYHHMQNGSIDGVSVGQEVTAGQQIGAVGSTGISTGPHLDFQVVKDGDFVDPRKYIPGYGTGNDYFYSGSASAGAIASGRAAAESSGSSKKSGGSGRSGGTSWSGLKNLKKLPTFK